VSNAFQKLKEAKKPVILLGSQVMLELARANGLESENETEGNSKSKGGPGKKKRTREEQELAQKSAYALQESLNRLGVPVFLSGMTRGESDKLRIDWECYDHDRW
jgi:hypothetical protein